MLKFATAQILDAHIGEGALVKTGHRHTFHYDARPGYLYVRSRAISSRCNDNWDEFPAEEIKKAYRTFIGKPVFVNHANENHRRARGVIIDAALHEDRNSDGSPDTWAEVLMELDAKRFPKLTKAILKKQVARTSMGCDVAYSICSACGNRATTPAEYCQHIPQLKGQRIYRHTASGRRVGELIRETCYGLGFFENSILVEPPADPTAHFLGVDTSGLDKTSSKKKAAYGGPLSWDEIGERHPGIYGDPEIHGEEAEGADGWGIGESANHLAHDRPADPGAEGSSAHSLQFHQEQVDPRHIDYQHHSDADGRVEQARRGYESSEPGRVPPLVLVHRHGVYQVADGHHRAQGAHKVGRKVWAYVAYSPHPDEPFSDGGKAPYHNAEPHPGQQHHSAQWEQQKLFGSRQEQNLSAEAVNQEGGELPPFPWDKAPKVNLPLTDKGWDDPRRRDMSQAIDERDMTAETDPKPSPYQPLIDRLPNHADSEMSNPYGMGTVQPGHTYTDKSKYPGDKREQWARDRWEQAHWPRSDTPGGRTQEGLARSKKNIRDRWSRVWKKPLACEHNSCPPWNCNKENPPLSREKQQNMRRFLDDFFSPNFDPKKYLSDDEDEGKTSSLRTETSRVVRANQLGADGVIRLAYGEVKAPADVDTLREENCPVCGDSDTYDGQMCNVCGFISPPAQFRDPDLDAAKRMDLRKQVVDPTLIDDNGELVRTQQDPGMPQDPQGDDPMAGPDDQPPGPDSVGEPDQEGVSPYGDQALDGTQRGGPGMSDRNGDGIIQPGEIDPDGNVNVIMGDPSQGGAPRPEDLPWSAQDHTGDRFTPGPDMPYQPEPPEGPGAPLEVNPQGMELAAPGTPGDGVPDLLCPSCGFSADATLPQTQNMSDPMAAADGMVAGDVCPNCRKSQLLSPGELSGQNSPPSPAVPSTPRA